MVSTQKNKEVWLCIENEKEFGIAEKTKLRKFPIVVINIANRVKTNA